MSRDKDWVSETLNEAASIALGAEFCGTPCEAFRSEHGPVRCGLLRGHPGPHAFLFGGAEPEKP